MCVKFSIYFFRNITNQFLLPVKLFDPAVKLLELTVKYAICTLQTIANEAKSAKAHLSIEMDVEYLTQRWQESVVLIQKYLYIDVHLCSTPILLAIPYTAVLTKVVPENCKSLRDNAD